MGRNRRKGRTVNGWLVIDKHAGITSTGVVTAVKRLTGAAKAGHGGTLDPLATGLLPIALGEATKTVPYVMDGAKTYDFSIRFGAATETDDAEGAVRETSPVRPQRAAIATALYGFEGRIEQVPPAYSAIKIDGVRAYDLARANQVVALQAREIEIHSLDLLDMPDGDTALIRARSGKGAYMRALARDIAASLGAVGHLASLRRTAVGPFTEAHAISLDELERIGQIAALEQHLLPVETVLDDIPALALTEGEAVRLRSGQAVSLMRRADLSRIAGFEEGETVLAKFGGRPVALARYAAGEVRPVRVLRV